ncbi:MAG: type I-B CRISPR-associated protein Cas8b/Csh1 [Candidatus Marinimicrobia bacterium]|nr:type I-B CRISPR-associated protein Cas8b/Csh1 [Candidatus Neomarinimicrobiota bacterium]MCF7828058.1 type I-B CRISPR-associated protein Cas8b/Csh1 [Candidatus Neomarinimicrobiota bacterium]MCF7879187.1 type I-B CRISPR-associated protein Cas8b/Csh1 [Candidatus Neomarinimicrobiota bacterium]
MIESCYSIGKAKLQDLPPEESRKAFLDSQTIMPDHPFGLDESQNAYEIVVNLLPDKDQIKLELGKELIPENRTDFFAFELLGQRSKKIYFCTNNLYYHLTSIDEMLSYLDDKLSGKFPDFRQYIESIHSQFYTTTTDGKSCLNFQKLDSGQLKSFHGYLGDAEDKFTKVKSAFLELVSKDIYGQTRKGFANNINICSLKVDGKYFHKGRFARDYIDVVYYERFQRFFQDTEPMVQSEAVCSLCGQTKPVTGKINIPTKFYGTTDTIFFENLEQKSAYKSFASCEECYSWLMTGIDHTQQHFQDTLFRVKYYLIPNVQTIKKSQNLDAQVSYIQSILNYRSSDLHEELRSHDKLIDEMLTTNTRFDFLFYWLDQASFNVVESIPDVEFQQFHSLFGTIRNLHQTFYINLFDTPITLNSLYWLLFPNRFSHGKNPDSEIYRKELVRLFGSLVKGAPVQYRYLLRRFNDIFHKTYHKNERDLGILKRPLDMNILLSVFSANAKLQGSRQMNGEAKIFTEIPDDEIQKFFEVHENIYKGQPHRQGLVLLGSLMNGILYKQQQENKSSTVLDKLNFDGMPVRRLSTFVNEISEYLKLYDEYRYNTLRHAAMIDRLQGIENSSLTKDEVVFYILTGISLGKYIGIEAAREKQAEEKS